MSFENYLQKKLIDHTFGATAFTQPAAHYVALYTTMPAADGTGGVEVSGGAYVRESVAFTAATSAGTSSSAPNTSTLTWPAATASWGTVLGVGICDASTAGNILAIGLLAASKSISSGDIFTIVAGNLTIQLS